MDAPSPDATALASPAPRRRRSWFADFDITGGTWVSRKTGITVRVTPLIVQETLDWLLYFAAISLGRVLGWWRHHPRRAVWFTPEQARPWYLIWPTLIAANARLIDSPAEADVGFRFEDTEFTPPVAMPPGLRVLNAGCTDIRKSTVATAFEEAFGYALGVDPTAHTGPVVQKSEANGVHDGVIREAPFAPLPGQVYQHLVDSRAPDGLFEDLRTPTLGGKPVVVFVKRRPEALRFTNDNVACLLKTPEEVFSPEEIVAIARFCARLGMDWGGIDALRDARTGRLYIVDANKTDMGPPTILPLPLKLKATRALGDAMAAFLSRPETTT